MIPAHPTASAAAAPALQQEDFLLLLVFIAVHELRTAEETSQPEAAMQLLGPADTNLPLHALNSAHPHGAKDVEYVPKRRGEARALSISAPAQPNQADHERLDMGHGHALVARTQRLSAGATVPAAGVY